MNVKVPNELLERIAKPGRKAMDEVHALYKHTEALAAEIQHPPLFYGPEAIEEWSRRIKYALRAINKAYPTATAATELFIMAMQEMKELYDGSESNEGT